MFASVIIPTHQRHPWVRYAIEALLEQDYPKDSYEVIVACEADGTEDMLRSAWGGQVQVVVQSVRGAAASRNTGLSRAKGSLAIFLDDDMEPDTGFISAHVHAHQAEPDARIAVFGYSPPILDADPTQLQRELARQHENFFWNAERPGRQSTPLDLTGHNCSIPVAELRRVGGYNESYVFQRDDFELCTRLLEQGFSFKFCRAACAKLRIPLTADILVGRAADRARNDYRLAQEHPWCVPYLPFGASSPSRRRRWRFWWEAGAVVVPLFHTVRRLAPENLRLVNWEYAARYFSTLRQITDWERFCRISNTSLPYNSERAPQQGSSQVGESDGYLPIALVDECFSDRALLRILLRRLVRRFGAPTGNFERVMLYNRFILFHRQDLHGGGLAFGQDFGRALLELGLTSCERIFECCAGPGYIGYALLAGGFCRKLTLADVNPVAVEAARYTATYNGISSMVNIYLSDGLKNIDDNERWDLVVGNPPHFDIRARPSGDIRANDPSWSVHRQLYSSVRRFMKPGGLVVLVENWAGSSAEVFEPMIRAGGGRLVRTLNATDLSGKSTGLYYIVSQW